MPAGAKTQHLSTRRPATASAARDVPAARSQAACLSHSLQLVAEGIVVTPLEAAFLALTLSRFDKVLQATRSLCGRGAALGAAFVPLHPQLILPLPRYRQLRELILNRLSHVTFSVPAKGFIRSNPLIHPLDQEPFETF
jgi:hypothetical protein